MTKIKLKVAITACVISIMGAITGCGNLVETTDTQVNATVDETVDETVVSETTDAGISESTATEEKTEQATEPESVKEEIADYYVKLGNENGNFKEVNSHDYVANISGIQINDLNGFKEQLKKLPQLLYIDMCDCGLTNEQMEELMGEFPDIKFVWRVHMGGWSTRTDALAFSTLHAYVTDPRMSNEEAQVLKYCTDLVSLDLGHNDVYDINFVKKMRNLHILIMVDNFNTKEGGRFNDLSVLKWTPNMMYLEFFVSTVSDLSFLKYNKEMVDLNISYSGVKDSTFLYDLPKIERLFMESTAIPYSEFEKLQQKYPDCYMVYYGSGSVDQGWRTHPRYFAMIDMYRKNYWNDLFRTEEELKDVATFDMLIIDGKRYYGTSTFGNKPSDEMIAGEITNTVAAGKIPTEDNSCNFAGMGMKYTKDEGDGAILVGNGANGYRWFYANEVIARLLREKLEK